MVIFVVRYLALLLPIDTVLEFISLFHRVRTSTGSVQANDVHRTSTVLAISACARSISVIIGIPLRAKYNLTIEFVPKNCVHALFNRDLPATKYEQIICHSWMSSAS